ASRVADGLVYLHAGPEIGVASTKAFTSMLCAAFLFAVHLGRVRGTLPVEAAREALQALVEVPGQVGEILERKVPYGRFAEQVKARGGIVIAIANDGDEAIKEKADHVIYVPQTWPHLAPVLTSIPCQLLAYHIAVCRGCDVDQPRNLAKSVTVE